MSTPNFQLITPHIRDASGKRHAHTFVIDSLHASWPTERG